MSQLLQQAEPLDLSLRSPTAASATADLLDAIAAAAASPTAASASISQLLQRLGRLLSPSASSASTASAFESFSLPHMSQSAPFGLLPPGPPSQLWSTYLAAALLAQIHSPTAALPAAAATAAVPSDISALLSSALDPSPAQLLLLLSDPRLPHLRAYLSDARLQSRPEAPAAAATVGELPNGHNGITAGSFRAPAPLFSGFCPSPNGRPHARVTPVEKLAPTKQLRVDCSSTAAWSAQPHLRAESPVARATHPPAKRNGNGGCALPAVNGNANGKHHVSAQSAQQQSVPREQPQAAVDEATDGSLEHTRQILSCLRCARAFNSLHELAHHMIRSGHFEPNTTHGACGSPFSAPGLASGSGLVVPVPAAAIAAGAFMPAAANAPSSPSPSQIDVEHEDEDTPSPVSPFRSDNLIPIPAPIAAQSPRPPRLQASDRFVAMDVDSELKPESVKPGHRQAAALSGSLTPHLNAKSGGGGVPMPFVRAPSCPIELQLRTGVSDSALALQPHIRPSSSDPQFGSGSGSGSLRDGGAVAEIIAPQENSSCAFPNGGCHLGGLALAARQPLSIVFERSPSTSPQATEATDRTGRSTNAEHSTSALAPPPPLQPAVANPLASLESVCERLRRDLDGLREASAFRRSQSSRVSSAGGVISGIGAGASEAHRTSERCNSCATDSLSDSLSSSSFGQHSLSSLERFVYGFSTPARAQLAPNAPSASASAPSSISVPHRFTGDEQHFLYSSCSNQQQQQQQHNSQKRAVGELSACAEAETVARAPSDPLRSLQQLVDAAAPTPSAAAATSTSSASASQCQANANACGRVSSLAPTLTSAAFLADRSGSAAPADVGGSVGVGGTPVAASASAALSNSTYVFKSESPPMKSEQQLQQEVAPAPLRKRLRPSPASLGVTTAQTCGGQQPKRTRPAPEVAAPTAMHPPAAVRSLRQRCACGLCGKWFANKGQLRLHQSKLKCPVLQRGPIQLAALGVPPGALAIPPIAAAHVSASAGVLGSSDPMRAAVAGERASEKRVGVGAGNNLESLLAAIAALQANAAASTSVSGGAASPGEDSKAFLESPGADGYGDCAAASGGSDSEFAGASGTGRRENESSARPPRPGQSLSVREASIARQFDKFAALAASRRV